MVDVINLSDLLMMFLSFILGFFKGIFRLSPRTSEVFVWLRYRELLQCIVLAGALYIIVFAAIVFN